MDVLRLSLARRDYLRHPVLLAEILALHVLVRLTSGPARRALGRAIGELKVAVCDRRARAQLAAGARGAPPPPDNRRARHPPPRPAHIHPRPPGEPAPRRPPPPPPPAG